MNAPESVETAFFEREPKRIAAPTSIRLEGPKCQRSLPDSKDSRDPQCASSIFLSIKINDDKVIEPNESDDTLPIKKKDYSQQYSTQSVRHRHQCMLSVADY